MHNRLETTESFENIMNWFAVLTQICVTANLKGALASESNSADYTEAANEWILAVLLCPKPWQQQQKLQTGEHLLQTAYTEILHWLMKVIGKVSLISIPLIWLKQPGTF